MLVEFKQPLATGIIDRIVRKDLILSTESAQSLTIELNDIQLAAVFSALGLVVDETGYTAFDDNYLDGVVLPALAELDADWVTPEQASNMLGMTKGRISQLVKSSDLKSNGNNAKGKMRISTESINARALASGPRTLQ
ncbi:MAG: hypothetical protein RR547_07545 [Raoultibacter sp.]